ncbi:hypothetical protein GIB67_026706, partial [Kingdonia uniflora]
MLLQEQEITLFFKVIMGSISKNCLGWAARDTSGVLSPYNFIRRDTRLDHVSLTITHCGICYADVAWAKNIPRNTIYPVVPGHEIVGIVKKVGSNVRHFKLSDHVGVGPYVNSCTSLKYQTNYPLVSAAPLLYARITVYAPMIRYKVNKPSKSLGVVGLGGLGHLAVKLGKAFGLHVIVFSTSNSKKDEALNLLGADKFIISSNMQQIEDFVERGILSLAVSRLKKNGDAGSIKIFVSDYYEKRGMTLSYSTDFPCINVGKPKRRIYLRLEICDLVSLQRYVKSLSIFQISLLVEKSRQKPKESLLVLSDTLETGKYDDDQMLKSCGIKTDSKFTQVKVMFCQIQ